MKNQTNCLFLIGMPGSGKSTIGKGLAKALGRPFIDLDHEIEARCGVAIPVIFEIEGEPGFRKRESQVLEEVAQQPDVVIATGGGAVLAESNREILSQHGVVIYLKASVEELVRRTSRDRNRPLLATNDPKTRLYELLDERSPIYDSLADIVVETGSASVPSVVQQIVTRLKDTENT
ncbi:shikimate kinase [Orrella daihaiensis]|uniref:Shikimate kinase n=1 Tax=Orrella daihaiensis TaxID=2782176 RepID=A0ABY4AM27_9BURK|nr:shikimate kinase [Orrella daihaiensis]UOD50465.1 shikimate kinase [Orrella daihaiensis]